MKLSQSSGIEEIHDGKHIRCTVSRTPFTLLHLTSKFLGSTTFHQYVFPSLRQNSSDFSRNIKHQFCWDDLVVPMNVSIIHFIKVKAVLLLAVLIEVIYFSTVPYKTFPSNGRKWTWIRMHCGEDDSCICCFSLYIFRSVVPVDTDRIDG